MSDTADAEIKVYQVKEGFYRILPPPSEAELEEYYKEKYYKEEHANYKHEYDEKKIKSFEDKIRRRLNIFRKIYPPEPTTCLDIGCGEGWDLKILTEAGWDVTGLDYSRTPCLEHNPEFADKIITGSVYDSLARLIEKGIKYQVLNLDNILEHVSDPYKLLDGCRQVIKPDGAMIIEVPNSDSEHYQYLFNRGVIKWRLACVAYPDHLSYFNIHSLRNLCDRFGFQEAVIVDLAYYDLKINGTPAYIDDYLDICPFEKALKYYASMADLGMGGEIVGFWGVK